MLELPGFGFDASDEVRAEALAETADRPHLDDGRSVVALEDVRTTAPELERIGIVPSYQADAIVRRAQSLAATRDASVPAAGMNAATLARLGLRAGASVRLSQGTGAVELAAELDDTLPAGCVRVAAGHPATAALGAMYGAISVSAAAAEERKAG
jgi:NADH-quinone oxidoreductase subunit G